MATEVNLAGKSGQDNDAANELQRLREENARLKAKRDNDENSAFGRLERESELRRQREKELADMRNKISELEQKNLFASLPTESAEALGAAGVAGVKAIIDRSIQAPVDSSNEFAAVKARQDAIERELQSMKARQAYNAQVVSWAAKNGAAGLLPRLSPTGDLGDKWAAFAQQYPGASAAYENGDAPATEAYVKLFMLENPGLSQQTATPSASGGFAPSAESTAYGPQQWMAEVEELEQKLAAGQITRAQHASGFAGANAKLAAAQKGG